MENRFDNKPFKPYVYFEVDQIRVEPSTNQLSGPGAELRLEPRVMEILCQLAGAAGQVVLREQMLDEHGSDEGITRAISILRKSLKRAGSDIQYIETIPKRGYRLIVPVTKRDHGANPNVTVPEVSATIPLAVLAFVDMSENLDQGYLSDGVSEEIINALVRLPFLRVSGRTSSFSFRGKNVPVRDIAKALSVTHVLEGSVRKHADRLRITAQLIEAVNDRHIWSETFDGTVDDIFDLQEKIASEVEKKLRTIFKGKMKIVQGPARLTDKLTRSKEAYDHFLRGRHLMYELSGQHTIPRAISRYERALEQDPDFVEAIAHLAIANFTLPEYSATPNWADHIAVARMQAEQAMALNPNLAWAHRARAGILSYDLKFDEAVAAYERAGKLDPNDTELTFTYAYILAAIGLHKKADVLMKEALDREPLIGAWYGAWGTVQFGLGKLQKAEALFRKSFDCNWGYGAILLAQLLSNQGRTNEALQFMNDNFDGLGAVTTAQLKSPIVRNITYAAFFKKSKFARMIMSAVLTKRMNSPRSQPALATIIGFILIGRAEKFFQHVLHKPNPYVGFALSRIWEPTEEARSVRTHESFPEFAETIGLVRAWQKYGWPEHIQPLNGTDGSNGQFICN